MRNKFTTLTLFDVSLKNKGSIISGPFGSDIGIRFFQESGIPVIRGNNLSNGYKKFIDKGFVFVSKDKADDLNAYAIKNDLIFTAAGTIGQVGLIEQKAKYPKYVISNKQLRVRLDTNIINPLYAYYWFSSPWIVKDIVNKNTGSTVPLINLGIIKTLRIDMPEDRILQDNIALILSTIDSKIELNNKINLELEAVTKTIYNYWFVQFDFPNEDGKPYKSSGGEMVWSNELKRNIPEGWEAKKLSSIFDFQKGIEPGASEYSDKAETADYIKFFRVGDIDGNSPTYVDSTTKNYVIADERDVIVTFDGSVGKLGFGIKGAFSGGLRKVYDKKGKFDNSLVYFIFRDERIIATIHKYATGSILLHASGAIEHLIIPFNEQKYLEFQNIVIPMFDQMVKNRIENKKLAELRDWLLPMLMNGQVSVQ